MDCVPRHPSEAFYASRGAPPACSTRHSRSASCCRSGTPAAARPGSCEGGAHRVARRLTQESSASLESSASGRAGALARRCDTARVPAPPAPAPTPIIVAADKGRACTKTGPVPPPQTPSKPPRCTRNCTRVAPATAPAVPPPLHPQRARNCTRSAPATAPANALAEAPARSYRRNKGVGRARGKYG